jgi:dTMP kinase
MLIAFEGLDQSGKETQARRLRARLEQEGHTVHALSFPDYDTPIGQEIRHALHGAREFAADVLQLLYVANRLEHRQRLEFWLASRGVVVCDRYCASSVAYGEAQGLDAGWLREIQRVLPRPDLTILLDIAPETAVRRKQTGRDRFERDLPMLGRVRESYRRQASDPAWAIVDAEQPPDVVVTAVAAEVAKRLGRPSAPGRS